MRIALSFAKHVQFFVLTVLTLSATSVFAQEAAGTHPAGASASASIEELQQTVSALQAEVSEMKAQMQELRAVLTSQSSTAASPGSSQHVLADMELPGGGTAGEIGGSPSPIHGEQAPTEANALVLTKE